MKYIVVGGDPFRPHNQGITFTSIYCLAVTDSLEEAERVVKEKYDECGGLISIFDTNTGKAP